MLTGAAEAESGQKLPKALLAGTLVRVPANSFFPLVG